MLSPLVILEYSTLLSRTVGVFEMSNNVDEAEGISDGLMVSG